MKTKIKILEGVAALASKNTRLLRTVSTYYILKSEYPNGVVFELSRKSKNLSKLLRCSERTFWTRIKDLKEYGLAEQKKEKFHMVSYSKMHSFLEVDIHPRQKYHYVLLDNSKCKLEYSIRALSIKDTVQRQFFKIKNLIKNYIQSSNLSSVKAKKMMEESTHRLIDNFVLGAPINDMDTLINTDTGINQYRIALLMGGQNASNGNYWTKKLLKFNEIKVTVRKIDSEIRGRNTSLGKVFYSRRTKTTVLQMPNLIEF